MQKFRIVTKLGEVPLDNIPSEWNTRMQMFKIVIELGEVLLDNIPAERHPALFKTLVRVAPIAYVSSPKMVPPYAVTDGEDSKIDNIDMYRTF